MPDLLSLDFQSIIKSHDPYCPHDSLLWAEWRLVYHGGPGFLNRYLERFSEHETDTEFTRRSRLTPIPTFAKREVNRVKNALFQRFGDILRRGGTKELQEAVNGEKLGVDRRGASMNAFLGKCVLPELLPMSRVGVLVDAPPFAGGTRADVPANFRPYVYTYPVERIKWAIEAEPEHESDFMAVLLRDEHRTADVRTGKFDVVESFLYYFIDESTGRVNVQRLDSNGTVEDSRELSLTAIPFVMFDIGSSLIEDAARHQIALLNLISSDTNYAIDTNFPFLTRQRDSKFEGEHLRGEDDKVEAGPKKGIWYGQAAERPQYIGPPTAPLLASLELRKELKDEIRELVSGAVAALGEEGTVDSGLAFIGLCLAHGENRIYDHWTAYEQLDPAERKRPEVIYPTTWSIKTEAERIEDASALADTMYKLPGRKVKKEIAKLVADKLLRGLVTSDVLAEVKSEIDAAPYCTSDPEIIIPAKEQGLMSADTGALALGGLPGEAEKAKQDQADRAAAIVAAQADADAARGNADGSVTPGESPALEKEGSRDKSADLGGDGEPGVRGEGR